MKQKLLKTSLIVPVVLIVALGGLAFVQNSITSRTSTGGASPSPTDSPPSPSPPSPSPTISPTIIPVPANLPKPETTGSIASEKEKEVCQGKTLPRAVSSKQKDDIYLSYGIPDNRKNQYDIDHLIALQLGGSNALPNLWAMPKSEHAIKTVLDNRLKHLVCKENALTLKQAQIDVKKNWILAYDKYVVNYLPPVPPTEPSTPGQPKKEGGSPQPPPTTPPSPPKPPSNTNEIKLPSGATVTPTRKYITCKEIEEKGGNLGDAKWLSQQGKLNPQATKNCTSVLKH